ncbi:MAG: hypothetical protein R3F07_15370 [Opitutaceae bacterium]
MGDVDDQSEVAMLARLCSQWGAGETQSVVMARQLLKRAGQLAAERGTAREEELRYLLELVVAGRTGGSVEDRLRPRTQGDPD